MQRQCWNVFLSLSVLAVSAAVPLSALAQATTPAGLSFSCAHTQGQDVVEKTVCASPALSAADRQMAALYASSRVSAFGHGPSNQLAAQRQMLKDMRRACRPPSDCAGSLQDLYDERSYDLAIAVLLRIPDLALPAIRKFDPAYAPIAEAISIWATEPQNADWSAPARADKRARILTLLRPVMANNNGEVAVTQIKDVLISDHHFAAFLNVIGADLDPNPTGKTNRSLTCEAIVRHPALLGATTAVFGGFIDSTVFDTDCDQSLPPTPALSALGDKLDEAWFSSCQGTIRFSIERDYQMTLAAVRLGLAESDAKTAPHRFHSVSTADITAPRTELAAYYAKYLSKPKKAAKTMARDAINALLDVAHECDPG
jgi:uncharacterized protein